MRIKDAAELAGTTVRTIRWYHQQALVPVPPVRGGHRDYELGHVARVLRVRWFAQAGLPLGKIRDLLADESLNDDGDPLSDPLAVSAPAPVAGTADRELPVSALHDLRATLEQIDTAIEDLHGQRDRVLQLIDSAESGRGLSAVPREISQVYDRLERAVPHDPDIQRVLRRERRMAEMLSQLGLIEKDVINAFSMDDEDIDRCVDFLVRFADVRAVPQELLEGTINALVEDMLAWCLCHRDLVALYLSVIPGWATPAVRSVVMRLLMLEYREPRQREVLHRVVDGLNGLIDRGEFTATAAPDREESSGHRLHQALPSRPESAVEAHSRPVNASGVTS